MHEIANISKKKRVTAELEIADTDFKRVRGLMFRDEIVPILFVFGFNGIFSIHSYFVKKEFDAGKRVALKENLIKAMRFNIRAFETFSQGNIKEK